MRVVLCLKGIYVHRWNWHVMWTYFDNMNRNSETNELHHLNESCAWMKICKERMKLTKWWEFHNIDESTFMIENHHHPPWMMMNEKSLTSNHGLCEALHA
jgi:hypothetical protein